MTWDAWWPAITSSSVVAVGVGVVWKALVEKGVQHRFDAKIEEIKSQQKRDHDKLHALQSGALANMAARRADVDRRHLQAAEAIWDATVQLTKFKTVGVLSRAIKIDAIMELAGKPGREGSDGREVANLLLKTAGIEGPLQNIPIPDRERLFVSPVVWALFNAYRQIVMYPYVQLSCAKAGLSSKVLNGPEDLMKLAKTTLPHQADNLDKFGAGFLAYLPDEIEQKLLSALVDDLAGVANDAKMIGDAAKILEQAGVVGGVRKDVLAGVEASLRAD